MGQAQPGSPISKETPMIFVFGSNEAGHHGAGAALHAVRNEGAQLKVGFGRQGNSFAIPTKDWQIQTLPLDVIEHYVNRFVVYARLHPGELFKVTAIGTGLGGLRHQAVAPMFKYAPANCLFDTQWQEFLPKKNFWGTF
jgi:hypothetical protein